MRIYEINSRLHCESFDQFTEAELNGLIQLGFDALWMMGVWRISEGAKKMSKITCADFEGSPYAVPVYEINRDLGGRSQFNRLIDRAHRTGLSVLVDFVSNHMALDSPWIFQHPGFFVTSNTDARRQLISEFFLHKSGEVIAFGRDPYFPPWNDTAQLDYSNAALRSQMIDVLKREAYWDKEAQLHQLGFDLCYEKKLYDALVARDLARVLERLQRSPDALLASLYFIENHDEPRAASVFDKPTNLAALAMILSIPGSVLIHEGQMEGMLERLPVQRIKPLSDEQADLALKESYAQLLSVTDNEVFENGDFRLFEPGVYGAVGFTRSNAHRVVAYLAQISDAWHRFNAPPMNVSAIAFEIGASSQMRLTNLLTSTSTIVLANSGSFLLEMGRLGIDDETKFCLVEASPA